MNIYVIGIVLIIIAFFVIGNYTGTKIKEVDDYYVSGRQAPTILVLGTLVASYMSAAAFMGDSSLAYDGYPAVVIVLMATTPIGYVLSSVLFSRYLRRSQVMTVAEFFEKRFHSARLRRAMGITVVIGLMAYLVVATQGAYVLMEQLLPIPGQASLLIVWGVYTSFTFFGGSKGVILTDTMMFIIFSVAIIICLPFTLKAGGGWSHILTSLSEQYPGFFSWTGTVGAYPNWKAPESSIIYALILGIMQMFVVLGGPWQNSRFLMAKNEHVVLRASMLGGLAVAIVYIAITAGAAAGRLIEPDLASSEQVYIQLALHVVPPLVGTLLLAGIMSAAISSASTFLSLIGFSIASDIIGDSHFKDDRTKLTVSRISVLASGLLALVVCYTKSPAIVWLAFFAGSLFASSWAPVAIMSMYSKKITKEAAFYGMLIGFFANLITKFGTVLLHWPFPYWLDPFLIGLAAAFITIMIVSRYTTPDPDGAAYVASLKQMRPSEYDDAKENKLTKKIAVVTIVAGILIILLLLVYYAIPVMRLS